MLVSGCSDYVRKDQRFTTTMLCIAVFFADFKDGIMVSVLAYAKR